MKSSVADAYKTISDTMLAPPSDTAQLTELINFSNITQQVTLFDLKDKLRHILDYVNFLSEYFPMKEENIELNNTLFNWYHMMPQVLDDNQLLIENKTQEFQNLLKSERFICVQTIMTK